MKESLFYVDDSPIHGKGLFARKYIGAGEIIGVIDLEVCALTDISPGEEITHDYTDSQ